MLGQVINTLKLVVGNQLMDQTNLPADKIDNALSIIGEVTKKEITRQILGGHLSIVMNLFSDKPNNKKADSLRSDIVQGVTGELITRLGLQPQAADNIADVAIPVFINLVTKKNNTTPEDDPSPINEIFKGTAEGKKSKGMTIGEKAKKILGQFKKKQDTDKKYV